MFYSDTLEAWLCGVGMVYGLLLIGWAMLADVKRHVYTPPETGDRQSNLGQ
jgi:hypothetical protein